MSEGAWGQAHEKLFAYTGTDDLAVSLAAKLVAEGTGWEDWTDTELDAWISGQLDDTVPDWRVHATRIKRARAGLPLDPDPLAKLEGGEQ